MRILSRHLLWGFRILSSSFHGRRIFRLWFYGMVLALGVETFLNGLPPVLKKYTRSRFRPRVQTVRLKETYPSLKDLLWRRPRLQKQPWSHNIQPAILLFPPALWGQGYIISNCLLPETGCKTPEPDIPLFRSILRRFLKNLPPYNPPDLLLYNLYTLSLCQTSLPDIWIY